MSVLQTSRRSVQVHPWRFLWSKEGLSEFPVVWHLGARPLLTLLANCGTRLSRRGGHEPIS
jgi:hypothetical protein